MLSLCSEATPWNDSRAGAPDAWLNCIQRARALAWCYRQRRAGSEGIPMTYDMVTIGGGFSGLVTACRAAEFGLKVAVLEARSEDRYPCSSRYTTGVCNVMGLAILAEPDVLYR